VLELYSKYREFSNNRILIVDDDEFCHSTMKSTLSTFGVNTEFQCDFCVTGKEAMLQVRQTYEHGMQYKVIFAGAMMPGFVETTSCIRKFLSQDRGLQPGF
jgi:CheY-like chemotaxis protein